MPEAAAKGDATAFIASHAARSDAARSGSVRVRRRRIILGLAALGIAGAAVGATVTRPDRALRVASAYVSHMMCSQTFVSRLDPGQTYAENIESAPVLGLLDAFIRYDVDTTHREVATTIAGAFASRAVYRDELGCLVVLDDRSTEAAPLNEKIPTGPRSAPDLPEIAPSHVVEPIDPAVRVALDRAFAERDHPPYRWTKAVVVVHDGRVIAERYAPGYGIDTPLIGNSLTKSVASALVGILAREGRLAVTDPAPVAAWHGRNDPRAAITIDNLLRHTSGLSIDETGSGFDPVSRMMLLERDAAGFAEQAPLDVPPGSRWRYTSGNYIILSRIIRDAAGGTAADVTRFAHRELFDPLGMRGVTLELDAVGTPLGSTFMFATARDWTRFAMLYLNDGMVGDRRILPPGWVDYSSSFTPGARYGYGAGFWTSRGSGESTVDQGGWGMPRDAFLANGRLGQFVVVVPSERLIVARFGVTHQPPFGDIEGISHLVNDVIAAIHRSRG